MSELLDLTCVSTTSSSLTRSVTVTRITKVRSMFETLITDLRSAKKTMQKDCLAMTNEIHEIIRKSCTIFSRYRKSRDFIEHLMFTRELLLQRNITIMTLYMMRSAKDINNSTFSDNVGSF